MTFLDVWIGYAIIGAMVFSLVFLWAVRARQFTDLDRGRHIPLRSAEMIEKDASGKRPSVIDRYTWPVLFLILGLMIVLVLRLAYGTLD